MNIEKSVSRIIEGVTKDLLNGKYKLVSKGEYTSSLKYGSNVIEIWTSNGSSHCKVYSKVKGLEIPEFNDDDKAVIYKLATTETLYMKNKELIKLNALRKKRYEDYKVVVAECNKTREDKKNFK